MERAVELVRVLCIFLEAPVRSDAVFRSAVHLTCSDLDLEHLLAGPEYRRVKRLIPVRLRLPHIILDAFLKRRELLVDHAERVITIGDGVDEDANRHEVVDLLVWLVPLCHLFVDRPEMLRSPGHLDVWNTSLVEQLLQWIAE